MMIRSHAALLRCARVTAIRAVHAPAFATSTSVAIRTKATAVETASASSRTNPPEASAHADLAAAPAPKPFDAIPRVPTLPILGAGLEFARLEPKNTGQKFHEVIKKLSIKYGPIVRVRMPGEARDTVLVTEADLVAEVLCAEGPIPRRRQVPTWEYYRKQNGLPMGLVLDNGEDWKRLRSAVQTPIFPPKNAHSYCSTINPATAQAMDLIEDGLRRAGPRALAGENLFGMEDITMRWSLEAVTTIILGQRLGALDAEPNPLALEMIRANNSAINTTGPVFIMPAFVWRNQLTPAAREHFKAIKTITDLAMRLMNTTLTECARDPAKLQGTFLGHVMQRDATITRDEMLATAVDLLFAGIDTTARSLLNIMNLLGRHPDVQAKLRDEIDAVVGTDPAVAVDATHLAHFKYLKNVIKEAMRLYMIVPVNARILPRDAVVGGHLLPQGTEVLLGSQAIAHKAKYFADPLKFNPERWESKDIHPFASLQFGFGPRMSRSADCRNGNERVSRAPAAPV